MTCRALVRRTVRFQFPRQLHPGVSSQDVKLKPCMERWPSEPITNTHIDTGQTHVPRGQCTASPRAAFPRPDPHLVSGALKWREWLRNGGSLAHVSSPCQTAPRSCLRLRLHSYPPVGPPSVVRVSGAHHGKDMILQRMSSLLLISRPRASCLSSSSCFEFANCPVSPGDSGKLSKLNLST